MESSAQRPSGELANGISHLFAVFLCLLGMLFLIQKAWTNRNELILLLD